MTVWLFWGHECEAQASSPCVLSPDTPEGRPAAPPPPAGARSLAVRLQPWAGPGVAGQHGAEPEHAGTQQTVAEVTGKDQQRHG